VKVFVNFALKKPEHRNDELIAFEGNAFTRQIKKRNELAKLQRETDPPKSSQELDRIIKHREILENVATLALDKDKTENAVSHIMESMRALEDTHSPLTVYVPANNNSTGYTTFSIPGGHEKHAVCYELRRSQDEYYFIVHNRGEGCENKKMHGNIHFIDNDSGRIYRRTQVAIKVDPQTLNKEFFCELLKCQHQSASMDKSYQVIIEHLLNNGGGEVMVSETEKKYAELNKQINEKALEAASKNMLYTPSESESAEMKKLRSELINNDPNFYPQQVFGTCTDSCLSQPEKGLASSETRKQLRQFSLVQLTKEIQEDTLVSQTIKEAVRQHTQNIIGKKTDSSP
jgi:hypothetical protein